MAQFLHERRPVKLVSKILKETQPLPFLPLLLSKETFLAVVAVLFPSIDWAFSRLIQ